MARFHVLIASFVLVLASVLGVSNALTASSGLYSVSATVGKDGSLSESYSAMPSASSSSPVTGLTYSGPEFTSVNVSWTGVSSPSATVLVVSGKAVTSSGASLLLTRTITVSSASSGPGFTVLHNVTNVGTTNAEFTSLDDWYHFAPTSTGPVEFAYSPSIKTKPSDVTPHWQFKSPAVMLQHGSVFTAIVPDLGFGMSDSYLKNQPVFLDLANNATESPRMAYSIGATNLTFHSIYSRDPSVSIALDAGSFVFTSAKLFISSGVASDPLGPAGFREVVDYLWSEFGSPEFLASPSLQTHFLNANATTFASYQKWGWEDYAPQLYWSAPCNGSMCGAFASQRNEWADHTGTNQDAWFNAWFQTLRTAVGANSYAQSTSNQVLMAQAASMMNLSLAAPQYELFVFEGGPFPSIAYLEGEGDNTTIDWIDDSGWAGLCRVIPSYDVPQLCETFYHLFDNSWTAFWMIQWWATFGGDSTEVLDYVGRYAKFLGREQLAQGTGEIPSWYVYNETLSQFIISPIFRDYNAETAGHALFLFEYYSVTSNWEFLQYATEALDFVSTQVVPSRKWYDFETFFSCSQKNVNFTDPYTTQVPENNLSKLAAAQAYLRAYQATQNGTYLEQGLFVLDYLLLTQSVFNHPLLSINTVGGFTTQNTDAEWNDARQAYASDILMQYYAETGKVEFLERGAAALRASLPIAPYENWAHSGSNDEPGALSSFHWGLGSALTSIEFWLSELGQGYVMAPLGQAVCFDGCTFSALSVESTTIRFNMTTSYTYPDGFTVVIDTSISGADLRFEQGVRGSGTGFSRFAEQNGVKHVVSADASEYEVVVNGNSLGTFTTDQLSDGIPIPANAMASTSE